MDTNDKRGKRALSNGIGRLVVAGLAVSRIIEQPRYAQADSPLGQTYLAVFWIIGIICVIQAAVSFCGVFSERMALANGDIRPVDERDRDIMTRANAMALRAVEVAALAIGCALLMVTGVAESPIIAAVALTLVAVSFLCAALRVVFAFWYQE